MKKLLVPLAASAFMGLGFTASPVSAAPTSAVQIATPDSGISDVRMTRREMRTRHRIMRNKSRPAASGNARNPNLRPMQQNQGQTTGGPSR
jgi:hypothetical protein